MDFTTPATPSPAGPLELSLGGDTTALLLGGSVTSGDATFNQVVPEPGTGAVLACGLCLLGGVQHFRRARCM